MVDIDSVDLVRREGGTSACFVQALLPLMPAGCDRGYQLSRRASLFCQVSAFQRAVRGGCPALYDHISKNMNELNLERCRCARRT